MPAGRYWGSHKMTTLFEKDEEPDDGPTAGSSAFGNLTGWIVDTQSAITALAITVPAEIGGLVMLYMAKDKVSDAMRSSDGDVWIYAAIGVFLVGFIGAFAAFRLLPRSFP